ncbi:MAG TPA: hypothetical protein VJP02_03665 [Candidatus Sulfotelmatobacter sp.]|nr:hypothetical protein [Candidatus Sulfotelmatobacter sp.]
MKRIFIIVCVALACAGIGWAGYRAVSPPDVPLSKFVPAGPLLYLEARDFSSLLNDWNSSTQKKQWTKSDSYEVFSRSRLFLRLQGAGEQFAAAAGLPPDMDFFAQVAGQRSAVAIYDIGKLEFLYITYLPSAKSIQSSLYQTRAKFEPRNAGGIDFYERRDPQSEREVAFAISGDYLLLATRQDLIAGALQLISGKTDRSVESESWWTQSTAAAVHTGELRMVMNLQTLIPNGYFRTYWVQQNITDLSRYSAAVSDLFRSGKEYREERVLIRKKEPAQAISADSLAAAADLSRLIPENAGVYVTAANPSADSCFALLETKILAPHLGPAPISQIAPQVQLTSGEQEASSDLETRIDQAPAEAAAATSSATALKDLLSKAPILASLQLQSTQRDSAGVFVRTHTAVIFAAASDWNEESAHSALNEFVRPGLTAAQLGTSWQQRSGYQQLDGLWPLTVAIRGKELMVSDDPALMESVLANLSRKSDRKPLEYFAGVNHKQERVNFARFTALVDHPNVPVNAGRGSEREPQFFSGNLASLSATLADVSAERIEIRSDGGKVRQTVTYEWSQ